MMASTIDEQIACVEREVKKRRQVYPRWVQQGQMSKAFADRQIEVMEDVATALRGLRTEVPAAQESLPLGGS
jgi:hypothetical protein